MFLKNELTIAEDLAMRAGKLALRMRENLSVSFKADGLGPVTNADVAIDKFLCQELAAHFPSDQVISEEGEAKGDVRPGRVWFIDPIDGTTSYIAGDDDFAVMIGLAIDGIARLGVIYQPSAQTLWRAVIDPDAQHNGAEIVRDDRAAEAIRISPACMPAALTLIASRTRRSARQAEMIRRLSPAKIIYKSSIGLKGMVIAEGNADFYVAWSNRIALWDSCAPAAILTAAGGFASLIDGTPLVFTGDTHELPVLFAHFLPDAHFFATLKDIAKI